MGKDSHRIQLATDGNARNVMGLARPGTGLTAHAAGESANAPVVVALVTSDPEQTPTSIQLRNTIRQASLFLSFESILPT